MPVTPFRFGDIPISLDCVLPKDSTAKLQTWTRQEDFAIDIYAVSWDILCAPVDLLDIVWNGRIQWVFNSVNMPIAPLSMYYGLFKDLVLGTDRDRADLEKLAATENDYAWLEALQAQVATSGFIYRGLMRYEHIPVGLPKDTNWGIELNFLEPFKLRETARIRINLHGTCRHIIEVG